MTSPYFHAHAAIDAWPHVSLEKSAFVSGRPLDTKVVF